MAAIHVTTENFDKEVLQSEKKVMVDFWASWCGPCRMLLPIVEELAEEQSEIKICKIEVTDQTELAERYQVMTIPTLILFENGEEIKRITGAIPKNEVLEFIKK